MSFRKKGYWKPRQTGIIISTTSILPLHKEFLDEGFSFILTGRFTQDALENLISLIMYKSPTSTSLEAQNNLRIIAPSQFMREKGSSNYQYDDGEYLIDFLADLKEGINKSDEADNGFFLQEPTPQLEEDNV
uniref:Putative LOC756056 [Strongylocentrotus purpuratus] n=1 Tax=Lepeophtheirus salmonis TaxID=72036 RepID=A0A0K2T8K3_LEPSM